MLLRMSFALLIFFCACTARMEVEMEEYKHFRYAHMLSEIGSVPSHIIYIRGYKTVRDDESLQYLALHYVSTLDDNNKIKPRALKFVSKEVWSPDQVYGRDIMIAKIYIACDNDSAGISSARFYENGKRSSGYYPKRIKAKVEKRCDR